MPSQQRSPRPGPHHRGRRRATLAGAALGCAALALTGLSCSVLIDQELRGKGGGAVDGAGGQAGGTGGQAGGTGGQTSPASTTTGSVGECETGWDCDLGHVAIASCAKGVCEIDKCNLGFADCNEERLDGCEVNLAHDDEHCGKCDKDCSKDDKSCKSGQCD